MMEEKFIQLLAASKRVFITSHISPDPDALSSLLLMGRALKENFPEKEVCMALEEKPVDLSFIPGFDDVQYGSVQEILRDFKPDLFILLDGNNYERCSRHDGQAIRDMIAEKGMKTIIIDHHQQEGKDDVDLFINNDSPATVMDVYDICFKEMDLKQPESAAMTAMVGFYADTGGFIYVKAGGQKKMFAFAEELVTAGADIEKIKNRLETYSEADMTVLSELAANIAHSDGYTYSFLSDEFVNNWQEAGHDYLQLQRPINNFLNNYIRNIGGRTWGFLVYKNIAQGEDIYSASFRSQAGQPDVSLYAAKLGGGGHKPAAGAKFEAGSLEDAIKIVQSVL
jgi:phosphoesterase RecJ-like protein